MENRLEFYTDEAGEHRWRLVAAENGEIIAASTEGYADQRDAEANFKRVQLGATLTISLS